MQAYLTPFFSNKSTTAFENVTFGTYAAIAVAWSDPNDDNPATQQHIFGAYGGSSAAYFGDATSITVSTTEYALTGLNITADLSLAVSQ